MMPVRRVIRLVIKKAGMNTADTAVITISILMMKKPMFIKRNFRLFTNNSIIVLFLCFLKHIIQLPDWRSVSSQGFRRLQRF